MIDVRINHKNLKFGDRGIWHRPARDNKKAEKIPARVLEHSKDGTLCIFTDKPIERGYNNLTYRTVTILDSDFETTPLPSHGGSKYAGEGVNHLGTYGRG